MVALVRVCQTGVEWKVTANGCGVSVWATKNVLELVVMMVTLLCTRNPELYTLCVPVWFMIACMFVCALLGAFLGKTAVNTHLVLNSSPRVPGTQPVFAPLFWGYRCTWPGFCTGPHVCKASTLRTLPLYLPVLESHILNLKSVACKLLEFKH